MSPMCCLIKGAVGQHLSCSRRSGLSSCLWITLCIPNVASYWFGSLVQIIWCFFLLAMYSNQICLNPFRCVAPLSEEGLNLPILFVRSSAWSFCFPYQFFFFRRSFQMSCFIPLHVVLVRILWWLSSLWYRLLTKLLHFFLAQTRFDCRLISSTARMKITSRTVPLLVLPSL